MKLRSSGIVVLWMLLSTQAFAQYTSTDSSIIKTIFTTALTKGESYSNLRYLCKNIGHRLTGSPEAEQALNWSKSVVEKFEVDTVYKQSVEAPVWIRGNVETVVQNIELHKNHRFPLEACALGGSVGTNGAITAKVVKVEGIEDLEKVDPALLKGAIVFYNKPMDKAKINTFEAYGGCVSQRYWGASEASKYGAVAVLVRSLTTLTDDFPHTGSMGYKDGVKKIPAAALSTKAADQLEEYIEDFGEATLTINLNCYNKGSVNTSNVIGEIKGSENPEQIIVFGAHIDSWDKGEGAHDDGAGVVQCMEVLRLFKTLNIQPKNTIRMVLFINEESGNMGGKTYAQQAKEKNENHLFALETDRGGFTPRGFSIQGSEEQIRKIASWEPLLEPYGLHYFKEGFGGVDIGPLAKEENLVNPNLVMLGLYPDPQRYFDYHHSDDDVFENVNQRELELGGASMAAMIYLLDNYWNQFLIK
jgi:carboxypeptidase Q